MRIKIFRGIVVIFLILMLLPNLCYSKKKKPEKIIYISMIKPVASEKVIFLMHKEKIEGIKVETWKTAQPLSFEDDLIKIEFMLAGGERWYGGVKEIKEINFSLYNKTSNVMRLIWDESAYIDQDNSSHKLIILGMRYIERDKPIPPTVIPPNSKIENIIYPSDYIKWSGKDWCSEPIFDEKQISNIKTDEIVNFGVFMMLEIDGERKSYNFLFEITSSLNLFSTFEEKEEKKE